MADWNLSIPEETALAVRVFLRRNGKQTGDLSEFVNDAVRRRLVELTVSNIKDRNARYDQGEILAMVDKEVDAGREGRS